MLHVSPQSAALFAARGCIHQNTAHCNTFKFQLSLQFNFYFMLYNNFYIICHVTLVVSTLPDITQQELSYRKQIARQLCTQYAEGIYDNPVTLKSRLTVTQGHCKRNHWVDHTRLTIRRVIGRWILSWPWNVGQRLLKVIEISAIRKLGCGFLFTFCSNYGRICSSLWDIKCQKMVTLKTRLGIVQGHWKWCRSIDHMRPSVGRRL